MSRAKAFGIDSSAFHVSWSNLLDCRRVCVVSLTRMLSRPFRQTRVCVGKEDAVHSAMILLAAQSTDIITALSKPIFSARPRYGANSNQLFRSPRPSVDIALNHSGSLT